MFVDLTTVLVFMLFAAVFVVANVSIVSRLLRPTMPEGDKHTTYECGEPPVGSSWVRFDMRFYTVALVFLIFDVEVALIYPWAVIYKDLLSATPLSDGSAFVFFEMFFFVLVLGVGLAYVWKKGDLDWNKEVSAQDAGGDLESLEASA